jgi:hypothetical protein
MSLALSNEEVSAESRTTNRVKVHARFEAFTAVTLKNAVFWDIEIQFVPHRKHYISSTETSQLMLCKI